MAGITQWPRTSGILWPDGDPGRGVVPDMLAGRATCHTNIEAVDCLTRTEGICGTSLVANDPPTHLVIPFTASRVSESLTATNTTPSPTHPVWALLGWVRYVEVSYTSPAGPTTRMLNCRISLGTQLKVGSATGLLPTLGADSM